MKFQAVCSFSVIPNIEFLFLSCPFLFLIGTWNMRHPSGLFFLFNRSQHRVLVSFSSINVHILPNNVLNARNNEMPKLHACCFFFNYSQERVFVLFSIINVPITRSNGMSFRPFCYLSSMLNIEFLFPFWHYLVFFLVDVAFIEAVLVPVLVLLLTRL